LQTGRPCAEAFLLRGFVFASEPLDFLASSARSSHVEPMKFQMAPVVIRKNRAFVAGELAAEREAGRWLFVASLS
jgi:hypothetical protein